MLAKLDSSFCPAASRSQGLLSTRDLQHVCHGMSTLNVCLKEHIRKFQPKAANASALKSNKRHCAEDALSKHVLKYMFGNISSRAVLGYVPSFRHMVAIMLYHEEAGMDEQDIGYNTDCPMYCHSD